MFAHEGLKLCFSMDATKRKERGREPPPFGERARKGLAQSRAEIHIWMLMQARLESSIGCHCATKVHEKCLDFATRLEL